MFMIDICTDPEFAPIWNVVGIVINIIWIGVPILLIVLGSIDLGKAVISSKEDEVKKQKITFKQISICRTCILRSMDCPNSYGSNY